MPQLGVLSVCVSENEPIYSIIASRAIRTSSSVKCHQEPFSFPSGFSESPTPASAEGASLIKRVLSNGGKPLTVKAGFHFAK